MLGNNRTTRGSFLRELRLRAGFDVRSLAKQVGLSHTPIVLSESRIGHMCLDKALAVAAACGATEVELDRVRILDALDRRLLPLPEGTTEEGVEDAIRALDASRAARSTHKTEPRRIKG